MLLERFCAIVFKIWFWKLPICCMFEPIVLKIQNLLFYCLISLSTYKLYSNQLVKAFILPKNPNRSTVSNRQLYTRSTTNKALIMLQLTCCCAHCATPKNERLFTKHKSVNLIISITVQAKGCATWFGKCRFWTTIDAGQVSVSALERA